MVNNFQEKVSFIWSVADLLRGDYKQSEYGRVILPLTVQCRLDSVLEPTKEKVLEKAKSLPKKADEAMKDQGRAAPKIVPRRGSVVHREVVEKVPSGFGGEE